MTPQEFEKLVAEEFPFAVPEKFRNKIKNVAFLVEQEPSAEVRATEHLEENETLLGYYRGVPHTARGEGYGVGGVLPDTITLYQLPIEEEARELLRAEGRAWPSGPERPLQGAVLEATRKVIRDTIWHEVAHHFGMDEHEVREREKNRDGEPL